MNSEDQVNKLPGKIVTLAIALFILAAAFAFASLWLKGNGTFIGGLSAQKTLQSIFEYTFYITPVLFIVGIVTNITSKNTPAKLAKQSNGPIS